MGPFRWVRVRFSVVIISGTFSDHAAMHYILTTGWMHGLARTA